MLSLVISGIPSHAIVRTSLYHDSKAQQQLLLTSVPLFYNAVADIACHFNFKNGKLFAERDFFMSKGANQKKKLS